MIQTLNDYHDSHKTFKTIFSPHCGKGWPRTTLQCSLPTQQTVNLAFGMHTVSQPPSLLGSFREFPWLPSDVFGHVSGGMKKLVPFTLRNRANWGDQGFVFEHLEPWQWKWWMLMDVRHVAMLGMVQSQPYCSGSNILPSRMPVTCCSLNENQEPCLLASHFDTFGCRHPSQDFSSQVDQVEDAELYILKDCVTKLDGQGFIT